MQESLPLLLDSSGGFATHSLTDIEFSAGMTIGSIDNLSQTLTIDDVAYDPCAYLVADDIVAGTGAWASRHNTAKVLSVAGSGAAPTYDVDTAIENDAVKYAGAAKYHQAADNTWGNPTTGDWH